MSRSSRRRRRRGRGEQGVTLIELVVASSLMAVLGVMAAVVMLGTQSTAALVAWRANAGSEIRRLLDSTFADLSSARPLAVCADAACDVITEAERPSGVLLSASGQRVCYLSQREDPIGTGDTLGVLTPFWMVCLVVEQPSPSLGLAPSERTLVLLAYPPSSSVYGELDPAAAFATVPQRRELGVIDAGDAPVFSFVDIGGHDVAGSQLVGLSAANVDSQLAAVAKVRLRIRLSAFDGTGRRTATRQHELTAALRTTRYQQERYWNSANGVSTTTSTAPGVAA